MRTYRFIHQRCPGSTVGLIDIQLDAETEVDAARKVIRTLQKYNCILTSRQILQKIKEV